MVSDALIDRTHKYCDSGTIGTSSAENATPTRGSAPSARQVTGCAHISTQRRAPSAIVRLCVQLHDVPAVHMRSELGPRSQA